MIIATIELFVVELIFIVSHEFKKIIKLNFKVVFKFILSA